MRNIPDRKCQAALFPLHEYQDDMVGIFRNLKNFLCETIIQEKHFAKKNTSYENEFHH